MLSTSLLPATPRLRPELGLRLHSAGADRWRVVDAAGLIVGHIDASHDARGIRYRALRYHSGARAFRELGAFWSLDDAVDCVRYAR